MTDFLIVGRGLAAFTLAHTLSQNNKTFRITGNRDLSRSSYVAAGIWNPVVFKRMTSSWMADELVPFLLNFYQNCEKTLNTKFVYKRRILKSFQEEQEIVLWLKKAKAELAAFLDNEIKNEVPQGMKYCKLNGDYGAVVNAGNIDLPVFLEKSEGYFQEFVSNDFFDHSLLEIHRDSISYKSIQAKAIVFCEGHLISRNPFFNWLPLKPAKGEVFTINTNADTGGEIFNRDGFIFDTPNGDLKCGATYEWNDLNEEPTEKGKSQLEAKLEKLIDAPYRIVKHEAGVRPSSSDRRPLIGQHPQFKNLFVFNGLGTKGVMLAPYFANNFVLFCLEKQELNPDVDIKRFYSLYEGAR